KSRHGPLIAPLIRRVGRVFEARQLYQPEALARKPRVGLEDSAHPTAEFQTNPPRAGTTMVTAFQRRTPAMASAPAGAILRHIHRLVETHAEQSDGQLLQRFAVQREEAAFAALLRRHGRLVWSVCRHILHHEHDAEDAFQATFLVLARRAAAIRKSESVASW